MAKRDYGEKLTGNSSWSFKEGFNSETCKTILDTATDNFIDVGMNPVTASHSYENMRTGNNFFNNQQFVYDLVWSFMTTANEQAEWDFEISSAESYQISKYEVGDFHKQHIDSMGTEGSKMIIPTKKNLHKKVRKLSMIVNLTDDFEGGDLILYNDGIMKQNKGCITFFPSYLLHEITPVTKGTRYSLSMWFLGKPFK
tara:strand:- start:30 stop:623 length:594 start_codon:yes stop_codon:yes gene_type:complete